ncbi:hypothetical protein AgCh_026111 [Apium graveolens]
MHSDSDNTINNSEGFEKSLRTRRNRPDSLATKPRHIYSDPPWVAKQLAFTIQRQEDKVIDLTRKIEDRVRKRLFEEAEDFTKELSIMINADPRLGDLLRNNFLNLLIQLLKHDTNPKLQIHAATILQPLVVCPSNGDVVVAIKHIIPIVVNLVRSREYQVRLQALWLLRNLIPTIPKSILEEALVTVTSFLVNDSTGYVVLDAAAETLSSSCQEYPNLSPELLKLALSALMKLIKSDILTILTSASWGLVLLCDGREEMVIEDEYLDNLVERLLDLINADRRIMIVSGLNVLGSLVRWGSDDAIEGVIDCKLIDPLFNVVQNHKLVDVKKEALWAISNAMCGVGPDQIECLRNICSKVLWDELLKPFLDDSQLFLVTLEGLAHMKLVEITCDGRQIDAAELQYIFKKIVYHFEWVTRCSKGGNHIFLYLVILWKILLLQNEKGLCDL